MEAIMLGVGKHVITSKPFIPYLGVAQFQAATEAGKCQDVCSNNKLISTDVKCRRSKAELEDVTIISKHFGAELWNFHLSRRARSPRNQKKGRINI